MIRAVSERLRWDLCVLDVVEYQVQLNRISLDLDGILGDWEVRMGAPVATSDPLRLMGYVGDFRNIPVVASFDATSTGLVTTAETVDTSFLDGARANAAWLREVPSV